MDTCGPRCIIYERDETRRQMFTRCNIVVCRTSGRVHAASVLPMRLYRIVSLERCHPPIRRLRYQTNGPLSLSPPEEFWSSNKSGEPSINSPANNNIAYVFLSVRRKHRLRRRRVLRMKVTSWGIFISLCRIANFYRL